MSARAVSAALALALAGPALADDPAPADSGVDAPPPLALPPPVQAVAQKFASMANPSISVNGLFVAGVELQDGALVPLPGSDAYPEPREGQGETFGTGIAVQEVEVQFTAAVDPYFDANVVFAIPGIEGIEIEEGYITLKSIPRLLVEIGKRKELFGRENPTHTHALLTVDRSLIGQRLLGEEGLNDVGINAALLLPTPWFSELTVGVDAGGNEVLYGSGKPLGVGLLAHWKNLVDLAPTWSLEAGVSGVTGENAFDSRTFAGGVDLTFKGHGRGRRQWNRVVWQSELMFASRPGADVDPQLGGLYSTLEVSFDKRFWVGGRFDWVGLAPEVDPTFGATLMGVVTPTEFSAFRIQAQRQFLPDGHTDDSIVGQLDFTLGAHPAHAY